MKHIFRSWNEHYNEFIYFKYGCYFKDIGGKYTVLSNIDVRAEFWSNEERGIIINGKQYFEGDIFKTFLFAQGNMKHYLYHILKFSEEENIYLLIDLDHYKNQNYKLGDGNYLIMGRFTFGEKCIGNIHQNPELLEG